MTKALQQALWNYLVHRPSLASLEAERDTFIAKHTKMDDPCVCPMCGTLYEGDDHLVSLLDEERPHSAAIEGYECPLEQCGTYMHHTKKKYMNDDGEWVKI